MRPSKQARCMLVAVSAITIVASFSGFSHAAGKKRPKKISPPASTTADATASDSANGPATPPPVRVATPTPIATAAAPSDPQAGTTQQAQAAVATLPDGSGEPPKCAGDDCPDAEHWDLASVFGVRLALMSASAPASKTTFGAMFWGGSEYYRTDRYFALRSSGLAALGGGTGGLEGGLGETVAVGIRVPVAAHHGPVVRIGLGGELLGNSQFYYSHIDLPIGELGYQFMNGHTIFEIGGRGGALITGRYNTGDTFHRELGTGGEFGAYVAAHSAFGRLDANFMHMPDANNSPGTGVDVLRGTACAYASTLIAFCLDGMYLHGDEQPAIDPPGAAITAAYPATSTFYGGVMAGFSLN